MSFWRIWSGFDEASLLEEHRGLSRSGPCVRGTRARLLLATAVAAGAIVLHSTPAAAQDQFIPCADLGQPLVRIPEFISENGKLRETLVLKDVVQRMALGSDAQTGCVPQRVRNFVGDDAVLPGYGGMIPPDYPGYVPTPPSTGVADFADPVPGPTLRARVGDLIELTFLNHVNTANYGDSIDRGDNAGACDETSSGAIASLVGYPQSANDTFPNCFHGSSTGNIHFHGTHTNPNSTGDNVFLQIRPSPRSGGEPVVTAESVQESFDTFFANCEEQLGGNVLSEWPVKWADLPVEWTMQQEELLKAYDTDKPDPQKLWPADAAAILDGLWPQYFIGAYPYCFRIPDYTGSGWPPPSQQTAETDAQHAGMPLYRTQPTLQMGQAPGTHWYHGHKHGSTAINVLNGMTGAFIIEGRYDDDLNSFYGTPDEPDWTRRQPVLVINELGVSPFLLGGGTNPLPMSVNGRVEPRLTMRPGEVQMWRIVNTSSRTFLYFVGPPTGFEWKQIAQDGVQFSDVNYQANHNDTFLMVPGNRVDLLVKAPMSPPANLVSVMFVPTVTSVGLETMPQKALLSIEVSGTPPENPNQTQFIRRAPVFPPFLKDITAGEVTGTNTLVFNSKQPSSANQHTVDGMQFSDLVGATVLLNKVEEWKVMNTTTFTPIDHPFHIHINPFQVVEVFDPNEEVADPATGEALPKYIFDLKAQKSDVQCLLDPRGNPENWKPCEDLWGKGANLIWWDTFPIPSGTVAKDAGGNTLTDAGGAPIVIPGYFKMRSRFVDYPGEFVLHCHILTHEDRGMMTIVAVTSNVPSARHH